MAVAPSASYSFTIRLEIRNKPGMLGRVTSVIGKAGGDIGAVDLVEMTGTAVVRDMEVKARDSEHAHRIVDLLKKASGVRVANISDRTFLMHLGGKIEIQSKVPMRSRDDLSMAYTPGVARVCLAIREDPQRAFTLTIKQNTVAVVTDGTAVLGLGDIGPEAAMPVMEGKAMLFKELAGVDAFPICLDTKDPEKIIETVKIIAPAFGGINLEDISAPRCFEIERRLRAEVDIPVFHDDQHGTAVVVLAALLNALRVVGKRLEDVRVVVTGAGAAGAATARMLVAAGAGEVVSCDRHGVLYPGRPGLDPSKALLARETNPSGLQGSGDAALSGADVFIGLSGPGAVSVDGIRSMAKDAIVFAMANPTPEVAPEEIEHQVAVVGTGRSDYPNQINNVLVFPGVFRGALDARATTITREMELAAANE